MLAALPGADSLTVTVMAPLLHSGICAWTIAGMSPAARKFTEACRVASRTALCIVM